MKFYGSPGSVLISIDTGFQIGQFDHDGEFKTFNTDLIQRLKAAGFKSDDTDQTTILPTIETPTTEPTNAKKTVVCPICNETFADGLALYRHKKKNHP